MKGFINCIPSYTSNQYFSMQNNILTKEDKEKVTALIAKFKEGYVVELTVIWCILPFSFLGCYFVFLVDEILGYFSISLCIVPLIALVYTIWKFKQDTKDLREDLRSGRKYTIEDTVIKKGTRTIDWTILQGSYRYKTIVKSFEYLVQTENHTFYLTDKAKYDNIEEGENVLLELAQYSNIVLNVEKLPQ